jgi:hypothetical protein
MQYAIDGKVTAMMRQGRPGKRTDPDVRERIEELALGGWGPSAIERDLLASDLASRAVSIRTIQTIVSAVLHPDDSGPWNSATAPPEQLTAVLPVLAWLREHTVLSHLTVAEAGAMALLAAYAPELPESSQFWIARRMVAARVSEESMAEMDYFLAFAPWRDGGKRYSEAFVEGRTKSFHRFAGSGVEAPETTQRVRAFMAERDERRDRGKTQRSRSEGPAQPSRHSTSVSADGTLPRAMEDRS